MVSWEIKQLEFNHFGENLISQAKEPSPRSENSVFLHEKL